MEYKILYVTTSETEMFDKSRQSPQQVLEIKVLEIKVNEHIKEGWRPLGGVTVNTMAGFFQAMIREEPGD